MLSDLEAALVARGAVQRGRQWRMRCPSPDHVDRRPSCDVDLSRGWICRSCGRGGSLGTLARLLGVSGPPADAALAGQHIPPRSERAAVEALLVAAARHADARLEDWREVYAISDFIRRERHAIRTARIRCSALGDTEAVWQALAAIAARERFVHNIEAALDAVLPSLR